MSFLLLEYSCDECGSVSEHLTERATPESAIPCPHCLSGLAVRILSAPKVKTVWGSVERGNSEPRPDWAIDTRPDEYK